MRINRSITYPTVRVTGEDGQSLGIMPIQEAQDLATKSGLDLVEIVANANPPVVRIMDFGKFRFEQKKKIREQKTRNKAIKPKEIRLRPVSNDHDVDTKINQLRQFLGEKRSVFVNVVFKSREIMFKDQGKKLVERIIAAVEDVGKVDNPPKFEGSRLGVRFSPKSS